MAVESKPDLIAGKGAAVLKALKKLEDGRLTLSTGFPVRGFSGEIFIALSQHAAGSAVWDPESLQSLNFKDKEGAAFPGRPQSIHFSILRDLALVRMSGESESFQAPVFEPDDLLDFQELSFEEQLKSYLAGYPMGQLRQLEIWNIHPEDETAFRGITYIPEIMGTSGAPLISRKGSVSGILISGDGDALVSFARAPYLKTLLEEAEAGRAAGDAPGDSKGYWKRQLKSLVSEAEGGGLSAQKRLARLYSDSDEAVLQDMDKSRRWTAAAAGQGDPHSMLVLAQDHLNAESYRAALQLIRKAAEADHPAAMFHLSSLYIKGMEGVLEKSEEKSMLWLLKAAGSSYPQAVERLAELHIAGIIVSQDIERGLGMISFLAERNYAPAKKTLAELREEAPPAEDSKAAEGESSQRSRAACRPSLFQ